MQTFTFECSNDAKGLEDFNSMIAALHIPEVAALYDYSVEYNITTENGTINRVRWWKRYTGEQR